MAVKKKHYPAKKDGTATAYYWVSFRHPDGTPDGKAFRTKREADHYDAAMKVKKADGTFIVPRAAKLTFTEWVTEYDRVRRRLNQRTEARNASLMRVHVLPRFGRVPLGRIDHLMIQEWATGLVDDREDGGGGLSPGSVPNVFHCLDKVLQAAVTARRLPHNPAEGVELPKQRKVEARFLTPQEVERLAESMSREYRALVLLSCATSLRIGELAGLRRRDVDVLRRRVQVAQAASDQGGHLAYGDPKTEASLRSIPMSRNLADIMAEHMATFSQEGPDGLVFPSPDGQGLRPNNFRKRQWAEAVAAAGLADITPHAMKHTAVARWISAGWDPKRIAKYGAHTSVKSIYDTYGHLIEDDDDEAAERVEAQLPRNRQRPPATISDLDSRRGG